MKKDSFFRTLTDENFTKEVIRKPGIVLVMFEAEWCGSCVIISPVLQKLAVEFKGKISIGTLDVDNNRKTALEYCIQYLPTLIFFENGEAVDHITGTFSQKTVTEKLIDLLEK